MSLLTYMYYLEYGCHVVRLCRRHRHRAYIPTSNTANHDNHEKINSWVSFSFLYEYGAPLGSCSAIIINKYVSFASTSEIPIQPNATKEWAGDWLRGSKSYIYIETPQFNSFISFWEVILSALHVFQRNDLLFFWIIHLEEWKSQ